MPSGAPGKNAPIVYGDTAPPLRAGQIPTLCLARFPLFGRFRAARLALARLALLVAVNLLLVGRGHRTAGLLDRFAGRGAHARHFDIDLGGDGALAEQTHAVLALVDKTGLAQHVFGDLFA